MPIRKPGFVRLMGPKPLERPAGPWTEHRWRSLATTAVTEDSAYRRRGSVEAPLSVAELRRLWGDVEASYLNATAGRGWGTSPSSDFLDPEHSSAGDLSTAREHWQHFLQAVPPYTHYPRMFRGRGVVIVGGGAYLSSTWVSVHILREVGCELPIELWLVNGDEPPGVLLPTLDRLKITVRNMDEVLTRGSETQLANGVRGFSLKVFACLFSSFEEVLYLDADNVAARDPTYMFDNEEFIQHGGLFWHDYWTVHKQKLLAVEAVMGKEAVRSLGLITYESGQMLINKRAAWQPLLLAAFMNLEKKFYYRLVSGPIGDGDKDLMPLAWSALTAHVPQIPHPPDAAGELEGSGFRGHTMVQYDHKKRVLFLHRNLDKWHMCSREMIFPKRYPKHTWEVVQTRAWPFTVDPVIVPSGKGRPRIKFGSGQSERLHSTKADMEMNSHLVDFRHALNVPYDVERSGWDAMGELAKLVRHKCRRAEGGFEDFILEEVHAEPLQEGVWEWSLWIWLQRVACVALTWWTLRRLMRPRGPAARSAAR